MQRKKGLIDRSLIREAVDGDEFIKKFEEGYCNGISALWSYTKYLQAQPKTYYLDPEGNRDKIAIESEEWLRSVEGVVANNWPEIEERLGELEGLLGLSNEEVNDSLIRLEGMDALKSVVKNKEQLKSFLLLGQYINNHELRIPIPIDSLKRVPRDDNDWFNSIVRMISDSRWFGTGRSSLNEEQERELDRFVSLIELFQHPSTYFPGTWQHEWGKVLEDTSMTIGERELRKEYSVASMFTVNQLKDFLRILETDGILQDHRMITVHSNDHSTSIFKNGDGDYYYYDPNSTRGAFHFRTLDKVAESIFRRNFAGLPEPSPLVFSILSFEKTPKPDYPSQEEILARITPDVGTYESYPNGKNGLMIAIMNSNVGSARYFLKNGVNPNAEFTTGDSTLLFTLKTGQLDITRDIIKYGKDLDFDSQDAFGWTPISRAINLKHLDIARDILRRKAVEAMDDEADELVSDEAVEASLLMYLLEINRPNFVAMARDILSSNKKFDINFRDKDGWSVIRRAMMNGHLDIVEELLKRGANPNIKDEEDEYLLVSLVKYDLVDAVKMLLEKGIDVDPEVIGKNGSTALMDAAWKGNAEMVRVLLQHGANHELLGTAAGISALIMAAERGNAEVVKVFAEMQVPLDTPRSDLGNWTALMYAAINGHLGVVKELANGGADLDAINDANWTSLMYAARYGRLDVVRELLARGADPSIVNSEGKNVIMIAEEYGQDDVIRELEKIKIVEKREPLAALMSEPHMAAEAEDPLADLMPGFSIAETPSKKSNVGNIIGLTLGLGAIAGGLFAASFLTPATIAVGSILGAVGLGVGANSVRKLASGKTRERIEPTQEDHEEYEGRTPQESDKHDTSQEIMQRLHPYDSGRKKDLTEGEELVEIPDITTTKPETTSEPEPAVAESKRRPTRM